jgi:Zn-dependent protease/predicted transcriptional regulator
MSEDLETRRGAVHETIKLGTIAGVRVGANWSVLIIAWLLAFGLAVGALPELAPEYAQGLYWVASVTAALVFFVSLLAHEMAHALVARSLGLPVEGITLWALGGVSRLGGDASNARDEFRIAIAGPATSLVLGAVFFLTSVGLGLAGVPTLLVATVGWLGTVNVLLALFNLVPAFPLDGGRVVRAALWARHGDRVRATRSASTAGMVFGYVLIGLGAVMFMAGGLFQGLWFAILGWFVITVARGETAQVEQRQLLEGVTVRDVMSAPPFCVPGDLTVAELIDRYVLTHRYSAYPIVDDHQGLLGLVTLDAIRRVPPERRAHTSVLDAATAADDILQSRPSTPLADVLPALTTSPVARLVAVEDGRVIGLVSHTDVVSCLQRQMLLRDSTTPPRHE